MSRSKGYSVPKEYKVHFPSFCIVNLRFSELVKKHRLLNNKISYNKSNLINKQENNWYFSFVRISFVIHNIKYIETFLVNKRFETSYQKFRIVTEANETAFFFEFLFIAPCLWTQAHTLFLITFCFLLQWKYNFEILTRSFSKINRVFQRIILIKMSCISKWKI